MKKYKLLIAISIVIISFDTQAQDIHRIACQGKLERLDSLLSTTININSQDDHGRSLLHYAVGCRQEEVFNFLINRKININIQDNLGETPLFVALLNNNETFFNALINLHADDDLKGNYGASLLEKAILNKNLNFVKKLFEKGVDLNIKNSRGSTPLEISMRTDSKEISEFLVSKGADKSKVRKFEMKGEYMGQTKPGLTPKMFAPNFISTEESEYGSVFNRKATEFYYGVNVNGKSEIRYSRLVGSNWTDPQTILTHERYGYNDPFLSPDENRLYFISDRALDGSGDLKDHDIWYVEKANNGWSEPINAGPNINSGENEYYISFTHDGTMYFSSNVKAPEDRKRNDYDIYSSKVLGGEFQKAISLGDSINTPDYEADVFVDPDESYIIFCATRPDGLGRGDLYISYKNADGTWSESFNMGKGINTENHELCPFVSTDKKYLFYTSDQDIYWISSNIIEELRREKTDKSR